MKRSGVVGWTLAAPALIVIAVFFAVPVIAGLALSLTDFDLYALADLSTLRFVGLDNYVRLLHTPLFWQALGNTLYFVAIGVPVSIGLSLGAALLLNARAARWQGLFRTALFAPVVTTVVAVAVIWRYLLHTRYGLINQALAGLGIDPVDWLGDPHWSMPSIILFAAWKNFGYNMIILLAALQAVPREIYEAARVDGAGPARQFIDLTFPLLMPTLVMVAIMTLAGYFQLFAEPYVMTQGGPLRSTVSVLYFMYEEGFRWWNLGYASAVAFLLFVIIFVISAGLLRFDRDPAAPRSMNPRLAVLIVNGLLAGLAAVSLFPLLWMVAVSLMPAGASSTLPTPVLPRELTLDNYRTLFGGVGMGRYLLNSVGIAVLATLVSVTFNVMAGYAFAKLRFRGRDAIFRLLLAALVIPGQVAMLPLFLMLKPLGLINNYGGAIVPAMASVFGIFLVRQFARGIPDELLEAARIDGASEFRVFLTIIVPLLGPVIATLAIFSFLGSWNDFMWPLIVLTDDALHTLPVALAGLSREHVQDNELMMAGSVVTVLPVLVLFLALQRQYMAGLMAGSVKG